MLTQEWVRDNTDMYMKTVQVSAKDLLALLERVEKLEQFAHSAKRSFPRRNPYDLNAR